MTREQLIEKYRDMMYGFGEYDMFDDDIEPKLADMPIKAIRKMYSEDKAYFTRREAAGGYWG